MMRHRLVLATIACWLCMTLAKLPSAEAQGPPGTPPGPPSEESGAPAPSKKKGAAVPPSIDTLESGTTISYGLTASLVRFNVLRPANEPGRNRNYAPSLEFFDPQRPPEFGFQFVVRPSTRPWRKAKQDDDQYVQLISYGGLLLVRFQDREKAQGNISLAATLGFFNDRVSLGLGFDLYRGIPIAGPDGRAGAYTAHTGLLSWAFAPDGEMTPENVFVVLSFSLGSFSGGAQ